MLYKAITPSKGNFSMHNFRILNCPLIVWLIMNEILLSFFFRHLKVFQSILYIQTNPFPSIFIWYKTSVVIRMGCVHLWVCLLMYVFLSTDTITTIVYPEPSTPPPAPPPPPSNTRTLDGFTDVLSTHDMMNGYWF